MKHSHRRVLSFIAAAAMTCCLQPLSSQLQVRPALVANAENITEGDFTYSLSDDSQSYYLIKYQGDQTAVTIPDTFNNLPVTRIMPCAFENNTSIVSVTVPDSVLYIEYNVFSGCSSLTDVNLSSNLEYINTGVFAGSGIEEITIPSTVKKIDNRAFENSALTTLNIPENLTAFGESVFKGTPWLKKQQESDPFVVLNGILIDGTACNGSVKVPNTVKEIGPMAFGGSNNLTGIEIPDTVTNIDDHAFTFCSNLTEVKLPDSLKNIGFSAFNQCTALTEITIPDSVKTIGGSAFFGCSKLASVKLPNSLETISNSTFLACTGLSEIIIPESVKSVDIRAFGGCNSLKVVLLPEKLDKISFDAFSGCTSLELLYIPESVTTISVTAFSNCPKLRLVGELGSYTETYARTNGKFFYASRHENDKVFSNASLTLTDDLGLNFYMDDIDAEEASHYSVAFEGKCAENATSAAFTEKSGKYFATAHVTADCMDETISATLSKDGETICIFPYSVSQYLSSVNTSDDKSLGNLVNATRTYGNASKAYKNSGYMPTVADHSEEYSAESFKPVKNSDDMIALALDSKLALRIYPDGLKEGDEASYVKDGSKLTAKKSGSGKYYFEITGISPTALATDFNIKYNNFNYSVKPLSWAYLVNKNGDTGKNKVMADSLYEYYNSAVVYKNEHSN